MKRTFCLGAIVALMAFGAASYAEPPPTDSIFSVIEDATDYAVGGDSALGDEAAVLVSPEDPRPDLDAAPSEDLTPLRAVAAVSLVDAGSEVRPAVIPS